MFGELNLCVRRGDGRCERWQVLTVGIAGWTIGAAAGQDEVDSS